MRFTSLLLMLMLCTSLACRGQYTGRYASTTAEFYTFLELKDSGNYAYGVRACGMGGYNESGKYYVRADTLFFEWSDSCRVYQRWEDSISFSQNEEGLFLMNIQEVKKFDTICAAQRATPLILFADNYNLYRKRHSSHPHYSVKDLAFTLSEVKPDIYQIMENEAMLNWFRWQMEY